MVFYIEVVVGKGYKVELTKLINILCRLQVCTILDSDI